MGLANTVMLFVAAVAGLGALGLVTKWIDRKVTARVQWRVGPPWYQPGVDIVKLLGKETIVPSTAQRLTFLLAPVVGFAGACVAGTALVAANFASAGSYYGDLIVVIYLLVIPSLAIVAGGCASGNPVAALGASREMKLVLAYELPFILALLPAVIRAGGSFRLGAIVQAQESGMLLWSVSGFLSFLVVILCVQAKLTLVPFDLPEAETEIMGGAFLEYSGPALAVVYATRAMMAAVLTLFVVTVYMGGIGPGPIGWLLGLVKYLVVVVIAVLMRNTNPRVRIDQAMRFFWFMVTPVAIVAVVLAALGL